MGVEPRVAAVIVTHNRRDEALRTIDRVLTESRPGHVIVVDNGSTDGTAEAVRARFPGIDLVPLASNAGAAGRNVGVARARAPYVALCDDDVWWAAGALGRAAEVFDASPRLAVATAQILVGPAERLDPACAIMARTPLPKDPALPGVPVLGFMGGASIVRRRAFVEAGGFEPRLFIGGEEQLLATDLAVAGWGLAYVDALIAHHHPSPRRDSGGRRRLLFRNQLWFTWMRRPLERVLRYTADALRRCAEEPVLLPALSAAAQGWTWAVRRRRVVPPQIEAALRVLDAK
jgi:GT2 family glycosyltransferase